jgi:HD-GYP domain-containing protein (c-di-GMP phosphodiesterase class II)
MLDIEPQPVMRISRPQLERTAVAFARFADLKSLWFCGHSESVAATAEQAGQAMGLGPNQLDTLRLAALLHDIGCVAVPTGVWDLPRSLAPPERRMVELHA